MKGTKLVSIAASGVLAAALAAAGCGGDDAEEPQTTQTAGNENVAPAPAPMAAAPAEPAPAEPMAEAPAPEEPAAPQEKDIVDTAAAAGQFTTLVKAIQEAGLTETLKGPGPFTVFAPTDEAFAKLPAGKLDELLKPENKAKLTALLQYHVVPGEVKAADVATMKKAKTVNGKQLKIKAKDDQVMINNAKVVSTDIDATNGVIHVIDTVLMPKGK